MRVIITGASGFLGSAVYNAFSAHATVLGLAHSRVSGALRYLDLTDSNLVKTEFGQFFASSDTMGDDRRLVIHCAAERRPDVAQKDPEATRKLNTAVPAMLAKLSMELKFTLIYISTDYVFDGTSPPYAPADKTNPLQLYGETKRDGEDSVLSESGADVIVLRVPVLYGPAPKNSDSAVNILLDVVQDQSGKVYKMDHFATRYPTNTVDIARFLVRLSDLRSTRPLPRIIHYSAQEPYTKYEMGLVFAKILRLSHGHIVPDAEEPKGEAASRPRDTHLSVEETEHLNVEDGLDCSLFEEWWEKRLNG